MDIEQVIREIKKDGRQHYLQKETANFSRILHDYTDQKKDLFYGKDLSMSELFSYN